MAINEPGRCVVRTEAEFPNRVRVRRIWSVTGVTRLSSGTATPFCMTHLLRTGDDEPLTGRDPMLSDANGTYAFDVYNLDAHYVVATKFAEYRFDSTEYTFDSDELTLDTQQIAGATANNLSGL